MRERKRGRDVNVLSRRETAQRVPTIHKYELNVANKFSFTYDVYIIIILYSAMTSGRRTTPGGL